MGNIYSLEQVSTKDISIAGGKGASLGELLQAGFVVPKGFVITANAFHRGLTEKLKKEILTAFDELGAERVAVRSSAIFEDSKSASWAGQLESYLNVTKEEVLEAVQKCWESINSDRAKSYASEQGVSKELQQVAVVIQKMVDSAISGVLFTANPINQKSNEILMEAIYGLGEYLVQGIVTPETIIADRNGKILSYKNSKQHKQLVYLNGQTKEVAIRTKASVLSKNQISKLINTGIKIEQHYNGAPQDIEWAISGDQIFIVQSRPITSISVDSEFPEFFSHCIKTIARPATLQRDELFRYVSNTFFPVEVVSIPLEGNTRGYYLETERSKALLGKCLDQVNTPEKLAHHVKSYQLFVQKTTKLKNYISNHPDNFEVVFKKYFAFLDELSLYLYVAVAIDKIIDANFKDEISKRYPKNAESILKIVGTPNKLHDYQKYRLEVCNLAPAYMSEPSKCVDQISKIAKDFSYINEYSFVERLIDANDVERELTELNSQTAQTEIKDIMASIEQDKDYQTKLANMIPVEKLFATALLIKEYTWLRTDRIDRLKEIQSVLRTFYEKLASSLRTIDKKPWTLESTVHLLNAEIVDFIQSKKIPSFELASERLNKSYLYFYTNSKTIVDTDQDTIEKAVAIITQYKTDSTDSLISRGSTAFKGIAKGKVVKVFNINDLQRVVPGSILVARVTMPNYTIAMKRAAGIITSEGGITSHAAIIARELGKPCVVGSENCMDVLKEGDYISLDSANQIVQYSKP